MIRPATNTDFVEMSSLIQQCIRLSNANDYTATEVELICRNFTIDKIAEKFLIRDVFVFERDDVLLGTVSLEKDILHSLFVKPNLQGTGIGAELVSYIECLAIQRGHKLLTLHSSLTAVQFYQKMGFKKLEFTNRANGSTYLMEKQLR